MARSTRRPPSGPRSSEAGGGARIRGAPGQRRRGAASSGAQGEPAILEDLIDVEAPPAGGPAVDTAAYAGSPETTGSAAIDSDLVDVEAPPVGGAAVDTAAYARPGRRKPGDARRSRIDAEAPPPPPEAGATGDAPGADPLGADPLDGEAGGAPPPAGPEMGGGDPAAPIAEGPVLAAADPQDDGDLLERAASATLRLAADRPWPEVTLREVAREAGVPFAALYARAPGRRALLLALSARLDRQALERTEGEDAPAARDRLFEAFMSRLEVMAPHRDALLAVGRAEGVALAPALPRTARALAEGSGVDTSGPRGALRLAALTAAWARTLQVWRDDEGALNRTMAEIDKLLTRADGRLTRVGAGF